MSYQAPSQKKTYDDISYEKRKKLIYLINEQKWTIKAAAHELNIKLCTAKYILYLFRKNGKIYRKRGESNTQSQSGQVQDGQTHHNVVYVPIPYYVLCFCTPDQLPMSLGNLGQE